MNTYNKMIDWDKRIGLPDNIELSENNNRKLALEWWGNLEQSECEKIKKEFGYFGHDIGTTEDDVLYFYNQTIK